jgi:hypothetical protein
LHVVLDGEGKIGDQLGPMMSTMIHLYAAMPVIRQPRCVVVRQPAGLKWRIGTNRGASGQEGPD